jgi:hypothetical protein
MSVPDVVEKYLTRTPNFTYYCERTPKIRSRIAGIWKTHLDFGAVAANHRWTHDALDKRTLLASIVESSVELKA